MKIYSYTCFLLVDTDHHGKEKIGFLEKTTSSCCILKRRRRGKHSSCEPKINSFFAEKKQSTALLPGRRWLWVLSVISGYANMQILCPDMQILCPSASAAYLILVDQWIYPCSGRNVNTIFFLACYHGFRHKFSSLFRCVTFYPRVIPIMTCWRALTWNFL